MFILSLSIHIPFVASLHQRIHVSPHKPTSKNIQSYSYFPPALLLVRASSSDGRALALHARGTGIDARDVQKKVPHRIPQGQYVEETRSPK